MPEKKLLLTGATGTIARQLRPALEEHYEVVPTDIKATDSRGNSIPGVEIADLTVTDRDAYRGLFKGCDAVVHCGFVGNSDPSQTPSPEKRFTDEMHNIQMAYNIYQTSLEENVRRVVVASSNHAADYFEPLILDGQRDTIDANERALSDNYYGWAKESYEHLGFIFAVGKQAEQNQRLENVQLRIGGPRETDLENMEPGNLVRMRRSLGAYLSERDMQQLFLKSIKCPDIRDSDGIPFQIFYGISGNHHAFWSIANARKIIGYAPQDNSEVRFADQIAKHIAAFKRKNPDS